MAKKEEKKVDEVKEEAKSTEEVTDILEEYYKKDGVEMVKRTYMNGKKKVREEESVH